MLKETRDPKGYIIIIKRENTNTVFSNFKTISEICILHAYKIYMLILNDRLIFKVEKSAALKVTCYK